VAVTGLLRYTRSNGRTRGNLNLYRRNWTQRKIHDHDTNTERRSLGWCSAGADNRELVERNVRQREAACLIDFCREKAVSCFFMSNSGEENCLV